MKKLLLIFMILFFCSCEQFQRNDSLSSQPNIKAQGRYQLYIDTSLTDEDTGKKIPVLMMLDTETGELFTSKQHPAYPERIEFLNMKQPVIVPALGIWQRHLKIVDENTESRMIAAQSEKIDRLMGVPPLK